MASDGPYLFRRLDFDEALIKPDSFFLNFEFPILFLAAGKRANVVTISCRKRMSGRSKSSGIRTIIVIAKDLVDLRFRRLSETLKKLGNSSKIQILEFIVKVGVYRLHVSGVGWDSPAKLGINRYVRGTDGEEKDERVKDIIELAHGTRSACWYDWL